MLDLAPIIEVLEACHGREWEFLDMCERVEVGTAIEMS